VVRLMFFSPEFSKLENLYGIRAPRTRTDGSASALIPTTVENGGARFAPVLPS